MGFYINTIVFSYFLIDGPELVIPIAIMIFYTSIDIGLKVYSDSSIGGNTVLNDTEFGTSQRQEALAFYGDINTIE